MQAKEGFRRAGLVLFNLTYGTTINIAKTIILGAIKFSLDFTKKAWNSNILGKIFSPLVAIGCSAFGAILGCISGIANFFTNFKDIIKDGNYKSNISFKDVFGTEAFEFKYLEPVKVKSSQPTQINELSVELDATPGTKRDHITHDISL